ncbi:hypothetical protein [Sporosarcina limicola]|uniref:Uncharacterized protein n=1 Tax=Sporosarcina limicola TaxID=34101 RepID=A0A927MIL5_9BACL|nr:hypothetical protein [Sporosarcina limicola]MBE1555070.1 hypothetical protein [Sporosarcina limicola]
MNTAQEIAKHYRFSRKLRRFSNHRNNNNLHASIMTRGDIERYYKFTNTVDEQLSKNYDLVEEDMDRFKDAIADYEVCVNKVIQMMDNIIVGEEWKYSFEELTNLIDRLLHLYDKFDKVNHRKLCQD